MSEPLALRAAWTARTLAQLPWQRRVPYLSPTVLARMQARRVRRIVDHAYAHVPHYRETLDRLGIAPGELRTAADLARLPILEKEEVQRDPERFLSTALPRDRCLLLPTEGSTGAPTLVWHDPAAVFENAAHHQRREAVIAGLAGRRYRLRRATIGSETATRVLASRAVERRSLVPARLRHADLLLAPASDWDDPLARIAAFRPDVVSGYGSSIEALYAHARRAGRLGQLPRVLAYGGDSLADPSRGAMLRDGFSPLANYGAGEAHHIAWECEAHSGLHVNVDLCPVRLVDARGDEVAPGEPGQVVISNLVNRGTVLLNYRLGDLARRLAEPCPCGRRLPLVSFPEGRIGEWVRGSAGEAIHGQEVRGLLLADDRHLLRFRIVQHATTEFGVTVVVTDACDRDAFAAGVRRRFAERFGPGTRTDVEFADALPERVDGKLRTVIGLPPEPPPAAA